MDISISSARQCLYIVGMETVRGLGWSLAREEPPAACDRATLRQPGLPLMMHRTHALSPHDAYRLLHIMAANLPCSALIPSPADRSRWQT